MHFKEPVNMGDFDQFGKIPSRKKQIALANCMNSIMQHVRDTGPNACIDSDMYEKVANGDPAMFFQAVNKLVNDGRLIMEKKRGDGGNDG